MNTTLHITQNNLMTKINDPMNVLKERCPEHSIFQGIVGWSRDKVNASMHEHPGRHVGCGA